MNPASLPSSIIPNGSDISLGASADRSAQLSASHERVRLMTERIFGQPATTETYYDPEDGTASISVAVIARGTEDEVLGYFNQWHRKLRETAGELSHLYLLSLSLAE